MVQMCLKIIFYISWKMLTQDTNICHKYYSCFVSARVKIAVWIVVNCCKCMNLTTLVATLTVMAFELADIFFPIRNWSGVMVNMQKAAPMMALTPSVWCSRYISTPIWTKHSHTHYIAFHIAHNYFVQCISPQQEHQVLYRNFRYLQEFIYFSIFQEIAYM